MFSLLEAQDRKFENLKMLRGEELGLFLDV